MLAACCYSFVSPTESGGGVTAFPLVVDPLLSSSTPTLPVLVTSLDDDFTIPTSGELSKVVYSGRNAPCPLSYWKKSEGGSTKI